MTTNMKISKKSERLSSAAQAWGVICSGENQMNTKYLILIVTIIFLSCSSDEMPFDHKSEKIVTYITYRESDLPNDTLVILETSYYDFNDRLLKETSGKQAYKFLYDEDGNLIEKRECRGLNCDSYRKEVFTYKNGKHLSSEFMGMHDTIGYQYENFQYDSLARVTQRTTSRPNAEGKTTRSYEIFQYESGNLDKKITLKGTDTVHTVSYVYDSHSIVLESKTTQYGVVVINKKLYEDGLLIQENLNWAEPERSDSTSLIRPDSNGKTTYEYDELKRCVLETSYRRNGSVSSKRITEYLD